MTADRRILVVDADLPTTLPQELRLRHFEVESLRRLNMHKLKDRPMLDALAGWRPVDEFVLVTSDDRMPQAHYRKLAEHGISVAVVDSLWKNHPHPTQDHWRRDTVHRWAHSMATQHPQAIKRYTPYRGSPWTRRLK